MTRVVEVAGMRIQIDQELQVEIGEEPAIVPRVPGALEYIDRDDSSCSTEVNAFLLRSGQAVFTAAITVLEAEVPEEVPLWQIGFAQNVVTYHRYAFYGPGVGVQITEDFEYYQPLRDGDVASVPFYAIGGGATEELQLGTPLDVRCDDDPGWELPAVVNGRGIVDASLTRTFGGNSFMTWVMLARTTGTDRQVVLLGRVPWTVELRTEAEDGGGLRWAASAVPVLGEPVPLDQRYDAATIPPVGGGQNVPDLRMLEGHTYIQGHLSRNIGNDHPLLVEWVYTGNECATKWELFQDPATVPNWLAGATP